MDRYRFYVPDLQKQATDHDVEVLLPEDEAHHLRSVLRLEAGASVVLFDGQGASVSGRISHVSKREARATALHRFVHQAPPSPRLTLCSAVPKGDRAEQLIDQASQLNAAGVAWIDCDRSVVKPREGGQKLEKWRRQAVESAKQCGRDHLLEIADPVSVEKKLLEPPDDAWGALTILWLQPGKEGMSVSDALAGGKHDEIAAFIGPEGGWSEREVALFEAGVKNGTIKRVRLTDTILRIETAAAAIAAAVMTRA